MKESSQNIEYFHFEEDFIEDNVRCIPMIVRLKLDAAGIKLTLKAWSRFSTAERTRLAISPCNTTRDIGRYKKDLLDLAGKYSKEKLESLNISETVVWENPGIIPFSLLEKFKQFNQDITIEQWKSLSILQRFALVKLSRPGHESRNFEKAIIEFGLFKKEA